MIRERILFRLFFSLLLLLSFSPFCIYEPTSQIHPNKKLIGELIANETFHYIQPHHNKLVLDNLWALGEAVRHQQVVEIEYTRLKDHELVKRRVQSVGFWDTQGLVRAFKKHEGVTPSEYKHIHGKP